MLPDARPTVAAPDDDPYLWLEEIEGAAALAWVASQNERTLKAFGTSQWATDRDAVAAILDRPDKIPFIARRAGHFYNFWTDAEHPRGRQSRSAVGRLHRALSDARSIKLHRVSSRDWYHTVESIRRSRNGVADNQGAALRPAGHGCGTVVERHTSSRARPHARSMP